MAEVRVIARALAHDGTAAELKELLSGMIEPTRAEAGCKYYELFESNIPGLFYFNELWESEAHLAAHATSDHFTAIFSKAEPLLKEPLEVNFLEEVN
jgi:quinol monooxygenase YgiN